MAHVQAIRRDALKEGPQTGGMVRKEAFATENVWVGEVRTPAGTKSGWHQHGDHDSYIYVVEGKMRFESGIEGREVTEIGKGEFGLVPAGTIHREENPGSEESIVVGVRIGTGPTVISVEGPEKE